MAFERKLPRCVPEHSGQHAALNRPTTYASVSLAGIRTPLRDRSVRGRCRFGQRAGAIT